MGDKDKLRRSKEQAAEGQRQDDIWRIVERLAKGKGK